MKTATKLALKFKARCEEIGIPPEQMRKAVFQHHVARGWIMVVWYKNDEGNMMLLNPDIYEMPKVKK